MVRQFDEDSVLDKVLEVFWSQGWLSTSMADLAAAAQVQRGSLYHAYGGKDRLFELAFERYAQRVLSESEQVLHGATAAEVIQGFLAQSVQRMRGNDLARGCFTTRTALEGDALGASMRQRLQALVDGQEALLTQALARAEVVDTLAVSPDTAARLITAFTRGLAVIERVYGDEERLRAISQDLVHLLAKPAP